MQKGNTETNSCMIVQQMYVKSSIRISLFQSNNSKRNFMKFKFTFCRATDAEEKLLRKNSPDCPRNNKTIS